MSNVEAANTNTAFGNVPVEMPAAAPVNNVNSDNARPVTIKADGSTSAVDVEAKVRKGTEELTKYLGSFFQRNAGSPVTEELVNGMLMTILRIMQTIIREG